MAITPSEIASLAGLTDQAETVEAVIVLIERHGLTLSWKVVSNILKESGRDPKNFGGAWQQKTDHVGGGVYVRKGLSGSAPSQERAPRPPRPHSKSEGLSWAPSFLSPDAERESWYGEDAGLRRLALSSTKCFSSYSEGDKACSVCPLARFCQEASIAKMDELARLLDGQEEARLAESTKKLADAAAWEAMNAPGSGAPEAPKAPVGPEAPKAPSSGASVASVLESLTNKGMTATSPPMPFKGVCSGCSSAIEAGSAVIHVRGRGMFHPDCAVKL